MGRSGSSSKKKYSKKKSLKVSSEGRRKKRSRRNKSKKLRRHDDSYSSCSDDDSTSSSPVSSSSSEGEYKSRKSRSRTRNEVKGSNKRSRRRSHGEDSTNDSLPVKKRRRSKKKADSEKMKNKKKIKKKKNSRRDGYITSSSSDSASCSTCGDGDSSSDEDTNTIKGKSGNRKNRSRTRRSSSPNNTYDDDNIENVMVENNPRRLKSVITIATQPENEEGDDMKRADEEVKEEMVYDYDHDYDYPSCKSNDSNDGETKKELVENNISVMSKEKDNLESGVDDLESILRQKALENLSRFRGGNGIQTKTVVVPVDNKQKNVVNLVQTPVPQPVIQRSRFTWRRDEHEKTASATYSGLDSSRSQPPPAPKLQSADLSSTERVENKITNDSSENITNAHENIEVKKSSVAIETPSSGSMKEGSSNSKETNETSQFEKKTMSVMRGGEMVQVSYKVYIPNRAPALARRQLKR